jgi:UDP-N-acetylmuramate: L-alanyl-gamma-D-glutamyl-meso-diaminopimelate ligase
MTSFKGASGRLQLLPSAVSKVYRDFAHAPSKVKATVEAVRSRHVGKKLVAVLELHTYSSLNKTFLPHYRNSLAMADDAVVFYNPHVLQQKRLPDLNIEIIQDGFQYKGLQVVSSGQELVQLLKKKVGQDAVFLFMSSGNFAGTDFQRLFE